MDNDVLNRFVVAIGKAIPPEEIPGLYAHFKVTGDHGGGLPGDARMAHLVEQVRKSGIADRDWIPALLKEVHRILWDANPRTSDAFRLDQAAAFDAIAADGISIEWETMPSGSLFSLATQDLVRLNHSTRAALYDALGVGLSHVDIAKLFAFFLLTAQDVGEVVGEGSRYSRLVTVLREKYGNGVRANIEIAAAIFSEILAPDAARVARFVGSNTELVLGLRDHRFRLPATFQNALAALPKMSNVTTEGRGDGAAKGGSARPPRVEKPTWGSWQEVRQLRQGGQGIPHVVKRAGDKAEYVLKELRDPRRLDRFRLECRAYRDLDHPNVVKVVDASLDSAPYYIVTRFYSGGSLPDDYATRTPLQSKLMHFRQVCSAVAHAHEKGVVHRDIKPGNIFLAEEDAVVGDFGLAHFDDQEERPTETWEAVGARHFMPPEAEHGRVEDVRPTHDVYSLGKLLYWMLAGRVFARETSYTDGGSFDLRKRVTDPYIHLLYEFLRRAIRVEPDERYTDAREMLGEFDKTTRRIAMDAHVLDLSVPQHCSYCGVGRYSPVPLTAGFGVHALDEKTIWSQDIAGRGMWLALRCDHCGNVQLFLPEKQRENWRNLTQ